MAHRHMLRFGKQDHYIEEWKPTISHHETVIDRCGYEEVETRERDWKRRRAANGNESENVLLM